MSFYDVIHSTYIPLAAAETPGPCGNDSYGRYSGATYIISSQADADALSACTTLYGDMFIQSDTLETITLSGIELIEGDLTVSNCPKLTKISAPVLNGTFNSGLSLLNLPLLTTLNIPFWHHIILGLDWQSLPLLTQFNTTYYYIYVSSGFNLTNSMFSETRP